MSDCLFLFRFGLFQIELTAVADGFVHRVDLACGLQGYLGEQRTDQLIDQDGKQRDVLDQLALFAKAPRRDAHTERDTCLRQQRDAEIFADLRLALHVLWLPS